MDAVISGQAGKALLLSGNSLMSFDMDDPDTLVLRQQADLPFLFGEAGDLRILENTNHEDVTRELRRACDCGDALNLTLIALDPEADGEIRSEAITELEELLTDEYVAEHLEYVLYGRPLPASADIAGALNHCGEAQAANTQKMLRSLTDRQSLIREVSTAWDAIPADIFGGDEERAEFQRVAVREGLFRALVTAREALTTPAFLITAGINASIIALKNHRQILQQWIAPFRQSNEIRVIKRETDEPATIDIPARRPGRGRHRGIDRKAALRSVESKKEIIKAAMQRHDLMRVRKLVDELVDYQLENGEAIHAAKSLCDLAFEAKTLGLYSLQLELAKRSTDVKPDDAWSWTQYGDAFLKMQRPAEALNAYEQAEAFGAGAVTKNGLAEVLKSLGRTDDALKAYDRVIEEYPDNVIAKTGRAEVLKSLGRLDDALEAYDRVIASYPDNVIAKSGRAEVLKSLGRTDDALKAYDRVIEEYPDNVIAKTGRAEVLKSLGRLDDALKAYDAIIASYPRDVFAKTGRAEVLKSLGRLDDALKAYDAVIASYPDNVIAKSGRAELLKSLGRTDDALKAYDRVIEEYPDNVIAKTGRAEVLKSLGRLDDALEAYDAVIASYPDNVVAKSGRAEVLKSLGRLDDALKAYDAVVHDYPSDGVARRARSCVLVALHRYDEALEGLPYEKPITLGEWISYHIRGMILLRTGETDEAVRIFEHGVQNDPFLFSREYFRTALTVALLRQREFIPASKMLDEVTSPLLQPQANVLRLHAFGALGDIDRAIAAYQSLASSPPLFAGELIEELNRQYISDEAPRHDEEWISNQEIDVLLLTANEQAMISSSFSALGY